MAAEGQQPTTTEYILHHLTNWTYGKLPEGTYCEGGRVQETSSWVVAHCAEEMKAMGFYAIHLDSMLWSIVLGLIFTLSFRWAAKKAHAGIPTGFLNFVEMIIEFIDKTVKDAFHYKNPFVAPLALTIFVWIFLMNLMDLVPVDWLPELAMWIAGDRHFYFKVVPTTDVNVTMAMGLTVFMLMIGFSITVELELQHLPFPIPDMGVRPHDGYDEIVGDSAVLSGLRRIARCGRASSGSGTPASPRWAASVVIESSGVKVPA
jgi:F-type H+-transporting ATPase subunit a